MSHAWLVKDESSAWTIFDLTSHTLRARAPGRDDVRVWDRSAIRTKDGALQVNFGEWSPTIGYLNEEWLTAVVFLRTLCDECPYPPSMCCMPPDDDGYDDDWLIEYMGMGHPAYIPPGCNVISGNIDEAVEAIQCS